MSKLANSRQAPIFPRLSRSRQPVFSGDFYLSTASLIFFSVKKFAQKFFSPLTEKISWTEKLPTHVIFAQTILKYATGRCL
jgi:hypothetical protein